VTRKYKNIYKYIFNKKANRAEKGGREVWKSFHGNASKT
jgi:hypothetical protein